MDLLDQDPSVQPQDILPKKSTLVGAFFADFPNFAKRSLDQPIFQTPWWFLVLYIGGVSASMESIDEKLLFSQHARYDGLASWGFAWGLSLTVGLISTFVIFFLHGGLYHLLTKCAGGKRPFSVSANVLAYSRFPAFFFSLLTAVFSTVYYGEDYWNGFSETSIDNAILATVIGLNICAVVNYYRAMTGIQNIPKVRGVIFLLLAPLALVTFFFSFYFYQGVVSSESFDEQNTEGLIDYDQGEYEQAIIHFDAALKEVPPFLIEDRIQILRNKYLAYSELGNVEKAIASLDNAIELATPRTYTAFVLEGSKKVLENNIRESLKAFGSALAIDPNSFEVHNELGLIYLGEYDSAFLDYERALEHNREAYRLAASNTTLSVLALNLYYLNDYENAETRYLELRDSLPNSADPWAYLGLIYYETERYDDAIPQFEKSFELNPSYRSDYLLEVYEESVSKKTY